MIKIGWAELSNRCSQIVCSVIDLSRGRSYVNGIETIVKQVPYLVLVLPQPCMSGLADLSHLIYHQI